MQNSIAEHIAQTLLSKSVLVRVVLSSLYYENGISIQLIPWHPGEAPAAPHGPELAPGARSNPAGDRRPGTGVTADSRAP